VQPSPSNPRHVPIGKFFLESGRITIEQLERALDYKHEHGAKLGQALVALGYVTEIDLVEAIRHQGKIHGVHLTLGIVDPQVANRLGEKESRRFRAIAINQIAGHTTVAMEDPSDVYAVDELGVRLGTRILPVYSDPAKIAQAIEFVFEKGGVRKLDQPDLTASVDKLVEIAREEERTHEGGLASGDAVDFDVVQQDDDGAKGGHYDRPVINLVRSILEEAFVQGASDIHFEPRRDDFLIRLRVDGILFDRTSVPKSWGRPILARIKVLSNLDIAQRRLPQDGRLQLNYKGNRVDLRLATTPSLHGEGAVVRVLDGGRELQSLEKLDFDEQQLDLLDRIITCRDGFVLATGPTGSGKTTTLYALLQRLNGRDSKIITLEDPVENEMPGVTQINANAKIGLTFAKGLRSILRQDPDVVLVGEIRDEETAEIAVQAALTGHIVLSTLHTVGAAETITRLSDMRVEPYLLADTLRGIIAQRLLRRICTHCRRPVVPERAILERLGLAVDGTTFFVGRGCDACHDTGFRGRIGIYEIMQMTPELCGLVARKSSTDELQRAALAAGLTTLRQDGIRKARHGQTTLHEVLSATTRG
jgi:type IV pilus assembly protein PilB